MTADDVYEALKRRHQLPEWVLVRELRMGTGYSPWFSGKPSSKHYRRARWEQRVDAWALNCYPSKKFVRIAYEIKVSHSDFIKEIQDPDKRKAALEISDYFYFVAPRGLIAPMEVPKGCGLLVIYEDGRSEVLKKAPRNEAPRLDWRLVASLTRNISQARRKDLPRDRYARDDD